MKRLSHNTGMQLIALIAIVFAVAQWGSQDVRFGVALAFVALIAFLAGRRDRRDRRRPDLPLPSRPGMVVMPDVDVPAEAVDVGNMPRAER